MGLLAVARAIFVRILFLLYCFIATWRVVVAYQNPQYWLLLGLLSGLMIETHVTIRINKGQEWKWFSPAMFFFLVAALPCLWLLELRLMEQRYDKFNGVYQSSHYLLSKQNTLFGIKLPTLLDEFGWALALEQSLLFILICCRGILPRGKISRDELSQILLVHMGIAADILDLFSIFNEEELLQRPTIIYPTLSLWTLSLLQYSLVITSSRSRRNRMAGISIRRGESSRSWTCAEPRGGRRRVRKLGFWSSDFWSNKDVVGVLSSTAMQDLPFFIFRLFLLSVMGILSHTMAFFTCKNALVVVLQIHRLRIIYSEIKYDGIEIARAHSERDGISVVELNRADIVERLNSRKPTHEMVTTSDSLELPGLPSNKHELHCDNDTYSTDGKPS
uniref:transmembrane protein 26-like n=1 Tax=Styela clava TaxID=7725 RepID=UPI001939CDB6|nr:transmembrane protein 26-like [Styela clava]